MLEALDRHGRWVVVNSDLGFPAGKNKTMLIDLSEVKARDATQAADQSRDLLGLAHTGAGG